MGAAGGHLPSWKAERGAARGQPGTRPGTCDKHLLGDSARIRAGTLRASSWPSRASISVPLAWVLGRVLSVGVKPSLEPGA